MTGAWRFAGWVACLAPALWGCDDEPSAQPAASGSAAPAASARDCVGSFEDPEVVYRLQAEIQRGGDPCPELQSPAIEVGAEAVTVHGRRLEGKLPGSGVERFEPLFVALKRSRENWKVLHPGEPFRPRARVVVAPSVSAAAGASALHTAALAGYPNIELRAGEVSLDLEYTMASAPPPPNDAPRTGDPEAERQRALKEAQDFGIVGVLGRSAPAAPVPEELRLAPAGGGKVRVRFAGRVTPRVGLDETVAVGSLAALLKEECGRTPGSCADRLIVEVGKGDFVDAAKWLRIGKESAGARLAIAFSDGKTAKVPDLIDAPAEEFAPRVGAVHVEGSISEAAIQKVLREHGARFGGCYAKGVDNNPQLQGRVTVRFTIGRDGGVWQPSASADLPDGGVVACVIEAYRTLRFPKPGSEVVSVVSSLAFAPG